MNQPTELIGQAVFTCPGDDTLPEYRVVASSSDVLREDLQDLTAWGPADGDLAATGSTNFHPLASGNYCISRTSPTGWTRDEKRPQRLHTQCLIVPPNVLAQWHGKPLALLRAVQKQGDLRVDEDIRRELPPLRILAPDERSEPRRPLDDAVLAQLAVDPGPERMAQFVQNILRSREVVIDGGPVTETLIAGFLECLPPSCRSEFSFTTGLRYSKRRPFRIAGMADDADERQRIQRLYDVTVVPFAEPAPTQSPQPLDPWPELIRRVLQTGHIDLLASRFAMPDLTLGVEDLPALALELLEELDTLNPDKSSHAAATAHHETSARSRQRQRARVVQSASPGRAHKAHQRFVGQEQSPPEASDPAEILGLAHPEWKASLSTFDELVCQAILDPARNTDHVRAQWLELSRILPPTLLTEAREQYLRYTFALWQESPGELRDPQRALQSLDILCILRDSP